MVAKKKIFAKRFFFFSLETIVVTHMTKEEYSWSKGVDFFATNSGFVIPVSLQPVVVDLLPFKLRILTDQIV